MCIVFVYHSTFMLGWSIFGQTAFNPSNIATWAKKSQTVGLRWWVCVPAQSKDKTRFIDGVWQPNKAVEAAGGTTRKTVLHSMSSSIIIKSIVFVYHSTFLIAWSIFGQMAFEAIPNNIARCEAWSAKLLASVDG